MAKIYFGTSKDGLKTTVAVQYGVKRLVREKIYDIIRNRSMDDLIYSYVNKVPDKVTAKVTCKPGDIYNREVGINLAIKQLEVKIEDIIIKYIIRIIENCNSILNNIDEYSYGNVKDKPIVKHPEPKSGTVDKKVNDIFDAISMFLIYTKGDKK